MDLPILPDACPSAARRAAAMDMEGKAAAAKKYTFSIKIYSISGYTITKKEGMGMIKAGRDKKWKPALTDAGFLLVSGLLFGMAYNMFLIPGGIFIGGAGGLATVLNLLYGLPTGTMMLVINIPLVLLFMHFYGLRASVKGIVGIVVSSVFVDLTSLIGLFPPAFPDPEENSLLYATFGGITIGAAVGLMFARGYTTGGSDLAALLIKLKFAGLPTAKLILAIDAAVVIFSAVASGSYVSIFFSFIAIFMSSAALEFVSGGFERTRLAYIFSDHYAAVADALTEKLERGVTVLDGMGWYTKEKKKVVLCVVKKNEIYALKALVKSIDPDAFMILSESTETIGEGFKQGVGDVSIEPRRQQRRKGQKRRR